MSIPDFTFSGLPTRVIFGEGTLAEAGRELERLGRRRALVLATPGHREAAERLAGEIGARAAGVFAGAVMHTPVEVTEAAVAAYEEVAGDSVVALGGGSTIGLGKAIALRTGADQVAVPTTYAGSEMTDILGETAGGRKITRRQPSVRPETVIYDVGLTLGMPAGLTAASGLNALAHAVEGLYARDRNPALTLLAAEAVAALVEALPRLSAAPADRDARGRALVGAWLAGAVLGGTTMALHHKLCHVLGGSFGLPHAATHAVVLPHAVAYNAVAAGELLAPVRAALGEAPGRGLHELAGRTGAPRALRDLGLAEGDLDRAAEIAAEDPYWNPRPVERGAIRALLAAAWAGEPPA